MQKENPSEISIYEMGKRDFIESTNRSISFILLFLSSIISGVIVLFHNSVKDVPLLPSAIFTALSYIVLMFVMALINAIVLYFISRILEIENNSFTKSITFSSLSLVVVFLLSLFLIMKASVIVICISGYIFSVVLFTIVYKTKIFKSLLFFSINFIVSGLLFALIGVTVLFSGFDFFRYFTFLSGDIRFVQQIVNRDGMPNIKDLNLSEIEETKLAFPLGFPFPKEEEIIKTSISTEFGGARKYSLEYVIPTNIDETKAFYESFFKQNKFEVSIFPLPPSIFLNAQKVDENTNVITVDSISFTLSPISDKGTNVVVNLRSYE